MPRDLAQNCSFLFSYFSCNLPENPIDVDTTVCTTEVHKLLSESLVPPKFQNAVYGD